MGDGRFSLSPMQEGMALESIRGARTGVYVEQLVIDLREAVDLADFQWALDRTVERHEALRIRIRLDGARATQEFPDQAHVPISAHDWSSESGTLQESRFENFLRVDRRAGFDLTTSPLHRVNLFRLAEARTRLVWTFHHAILDGRSHPIVLGDLFCFYEARGAGVAVPSSPAPSYRSYLRWLEARDPVRSDGYWRDLLEGCIPGQLPDLPDPSTAQADAPTHAELEHHLDLECSRRLASLAEEHDVTLNTVLQAAWALLLERYCGSDDIVFGATRACRHGSVPEVEQTAGVFINTLPMRVRLAELDTVGDLLRALRDQHVSHREHEQSSLARIQSLVESESSAPLLATLLMVEDRPLLAAMCEQDEGWRERDLRVIDQTSFPLALVVRLGERITLELEYDASRFEDPAIRRMMEHVGNLLHSLGSGDRELAGVEMISAAEREQWERKIGSSPGSPAHPDAMPLVHDAIVARCVLQPEAIAVESGPQRLRYGELAEKSRFLAAHLRSVGVQPGEAIGLCLGRSPDLLIAVLAAMEAGASYVPLDPELPADRLREMAADSGIRWVLAQRRTEPTVAHLRMPVMSVDGRWSEHVSEPDSARRRASRDDIAYILYTSGTTGKPKGVMIGHAALANHAAAMQECFGLDPSDRVLQFASFSFDVAFEEIFPTLIAGATLVLRDDEMVSTASRFLEATGEAAISVLNLPTAYWHELVKGVGASRDSWPRSLRLLTVGGETASPSLLRKWKSQGTDHVRFLNAYGPTETTVTTTVFDPATDRWDGADVPIGRPIANTTAMVLDRKMRPMPFDVVGELFIGGAGVAEGYRGLPELTDRRFVPSLFEASPGRLYATGDRARMRADGCLMFVGRDDDQVKVRGYRIEPGEIEEVVMSHPAIQSVAVVARRSKGGATDSLVAYYVATQGEDFDATELHDHAARALPAYMIPAHWVAIDSIPISHTGKVDRKSLAARKVQIDVTREVASADEPRDAVEEMLVKLWEDLLEVGGVGIHDNFFEHGGHSLLAVQMMTDLEDELRVSCEIPDFFGNPTIAGLAQTIRALQAAAQQPVELDEALAPRIHAAREATVIPLREDGIGIPLYCVFGFDQYVDLARDLSRRFPVYGVYHPVESMIIDVGRGRHVDAQIPSVEETAAGYVKAIRAHRPQGPYCLGGLSFGGTVAFEVARQLVEAGESVPVLALFDTILPRARKPDPLGWSRAQWDSLRRDPATAIPMKLRRLKELVQSHFDEWTGRRGWPGSRTDLEELAAASDYVQARERAYHIMSNRYDRPGLRYDGAAVLFRAFRRDESSRHRVDYAHGWSEIIHGGLDVRVVEGDHRGILQQPHVAGLADALAHYLELADGIRHEEE